MKWFDRTREAISTPTTERLPRCDCGGGSRRLSLLRETTFRAWISRDCLYRLPVTFYREISMKSYERATRTSYTHRPITGSTDLYRQLRRLQKNSEMSMLRPLLETMDALQSSPFSRDEHDLILSG